MATHDDAPPPEKPRRAVVTDGSVAVEVVPLDALTPLADNPRTHTSRGIDVITASLDRVGPRALEPTPDRGVGARMRAGLRASNRRARHLPMRYETGLPSSVIRFRT